MRQRLVQHFADTSPSLFRILKRNELLTAPEFAVSKIQCKSVMVEMRDGVRLATDLYLPPILPAPTIAVRTPYGKSWDPYAGAFLSLARRGYIVVAQDCRGTGDSEPDNWDYYVYEADDSFDLIEWISQREWCDGFVGSCGGSYDAQTQWCMAMHPRMSTIVPDVGGLGIATNTASLHMLVNAYARSIGKGAGKVPVHYTEMESLFEAETMAGGYFNKPLYYPFHDTLLARFPTLRDLPSHEARKWLWERYCAMTCAQRAELLKQSLGVKDITAMDVESLPTIFGREISHDRYALPHPRPVEMCESFHAPVLLRTGWYDWSLNDTLATWELLMRTAPEPMRSRCRLFISPSAHNMPGYHEGVAEHPELHHAYGVTNNLEMLLRWYAAVREDEIDSWPNVIYYLMGANEWRVADAWPLPGAHSIPFYLGADGRLTTELPQPSAPDCYTYNPEDATPTVGGSIVSYLYPPGSVDVSAVQKRPDVLTYTTAPLKHGLDVVGPLRLILYASSSAIDTDFSGRLSDVLPDSRAIQLQSGMLRARYRNITGEPELLEPGRIYRLEVDMWATANYFQAGHRLRLDISSADFPRFNRNANRGGEPGDPVRAAQTIFHDPEHPSHLLLSVLPGPFLHDPPGTETS